MEDEDDVLFRPPETTPEDNRFFVRVAFAFTVVLFGVLTWIGLPLHTDAAPAGIVDFELARTTRAMEAILASWDEAARGRAALSLAVDYAFLVAYATWLWSALRILAERFDDERSIWFRRLATAMWLAAGLDAVENAALGVVLAGGFDPANPEIDATWPALAFTCALFKFLLVGGGILGLTVGTLRAPKD